MKFRKLLTQFNLSLAHQTLPRTHQTTSRYSRCLQPITKLGKLTYRFGFFGRNVCPKFNPENTYRLALEGSATHSLSIKVVMFRHQIVFPLKVGLTEQISRTCPSEIGEMFQGFLSLGGVEVTKNWLNTQEYQVILVIFETQLL